MNGQEKLGYKLFEKWAKPKGQTFERSNALGYDDIVIDKDGSRWKSEVKNSKRHTLKADFLFVTGNILELGEEVHFCIHRKTLNHRNSDQR